MATYVNDLRLKEITTGDESGTWGTSTNTNLELIGEALGFGTEGITTNADTHTTTVADGSTDPGRAMYLKYTGTLDSACTITIAPNTISRMQFIENGTSGSQNIIISQGSGANITIPPGDTKAVYLDGAGSGAAVVDAFASLNTVDLKVEDDLTVTDDVSIGGATTIGGVLDITDTTDSSDATGDTGALRTEGGASIAKKLYVGTDLDVDGTTNLDAVDIDGAVDMASTLLVGGTVLATSAAAVNSTSAGGFGFASNVTQFYSFGADASTAGSYTFQTLSNNAAINVTPLQISSTGIIINEASGDLDFRIESNGNAGMFFVDGGNDKIGIGTTSPVSEMHINSSQSDTTLTIESDISSSLFTSGIDLIRDSVAAGSRIESLRDASNGGVGLKFLTTANNAAEVNGTLTSRMVILETGEVGIGTDSPGSALHVDKSFSGTLVTIHNTAGAASTDRGLDVETSSTGTTTQRWLNSGSELARLTGGGAFVIGNTAVVNSAAVTVQSNDNLGLVVGQTGTNAYRNYRHIVSTGIHTFASSNNTASLSNGGAWTNASDIAYKNNIVDTVHGLETIKALQPRDYKLKASNEADTGFIAQELESVLPQFVIGEEGDKNVNYAQITAVLTKAMQELEARVTTLEG